MYDFALEDCITIIQVKYVSIGIFLRLGFENIEIYTFQALWERYTDFLLAMGKHLGHYETIEPQIKG